MILSLTIFFNVLKQILEYVEKESSLKLSCEDIQKEASAKPGTVEVNQVAIPTGGKSQDSSSGGSKNPAQKSAGNQGGAKGGKKEDKVCYYCNKSGHIKADCRKKKYYDSIRNSGQNTSSSFYGNYSNNSNFKYNPNYNQNVYSNQGFQQSRPSAGQ